MTIFRSKPIATIIAVAAVGGLIFAMLWFLYDRYGPLSKFIRRIEHRYGISKLALQPAGGDLGVGEASWVTPMTDRAMIHYNASLIGRALSESRPSWHRIRIHVRLETGGTVLEYLYDRDSELLWAANKEALLPFTPAAPVRRDPMLEAITGWLKTRLPDADNTRYRRDGKEIWVSCTTAEFGAVLDYDAEALCRARPELGSKEAGFSGLVLDLTDARTGEINRYTYAIPDGPFIRLGPVAPAPDAGTRPPAGTAEAAPGR